MNEWMNNPLFENLDPVKRELIQMAAEKTAGKSGNAMATTMMSLVTSANKKGIRFTPEEMTLILDMLKDGKSPQEKAKIDQTVNLVMGMMKRKTPTK